MRKHWTTWDEATQEYAKHTGLIPELSEFTSLYHNYRNNWKHFDGFIDWMRYNVA